MGHRLSFFDQPRRTVASRRVWAHGIYRNFFVDRSGNEDLHRFADERGAHEFAARQSAAAEREGKCRRSANEVATAVAAALALDPSEAEKMRVAAVTGYNEMQSAARKLSSRNGTVKTGIDVLEETKFAALHPAKGGAPRSIGLLTNQTGIDSEGRRTLDILANVAGLSLDAIFSPSTV